jgi:hypothetical protein
MASPTPEGSWTIRIIIRSTAVSEPRMARESIIEVLYEAISKVNGEA